MRKDKGSANLEYIITVICILLVLTAVIQLTTSNLTAVRQTQERKKARITVEQITSIINNLNRQKDRYTTTYRMPDKLDEESYIIQVNRTEVYINSHYQLSSMKISQNKPLKHKNYILLPSHTYQFTQENGTIDITPG